MTITEACHEATCRLEESPLIINSGRCFQWATIVFDLVEGSKIWGHNVDGFGHSFIEHEGRFYDAESPEGVKDWQDLPFFQRVYENAR